MGSLEFENTTEFLWLSIGQPGDHGYSLLFVKSHINVNKGLGIISYEHCLTFYTFAQKVFFGYW